MTNGLTNTTVCQNIKSMQSYGVKQGESNGKRIQVTHCLSDRYAIMWYMVDIQSNYEISTKIRLFP